jgi:hypothetical protein
MVYINVSFQTAFHHNADDVGREDSEVLKPAATAVLWGHQSHWKENYAQIVIQSSVG